MVDSTSDSQLNQGEVDYEFESNEVLEPLSVVDDQFVPKVRMTFTTLEDAGKFYRNYAKVAGFSTRVWSTNRKENEIKNQLITCSREEKWKSKISPTEKTNPTTGLNCPVRIYIHTLKDVGAWIISKVVLDHSHPCYPNLYEDRHIWVPIYLDHHFWTGMRSTQRSKSMHSFFNKFITQNSSLIQFVKQYDNCLGSREQAERESDAADFHTVILLTNYALGYSVYEVGEQVSSSIFNKFVVTYDSVAAEIKCQCLLFESRGILCRHALSVLSFEQELTAILHRAYDNAMAEMESLKAKRKGTSSLSHEDANLKSVNELQSPPRIRTRGRPKNRLGSKLDK
ncbi:hypothetical protein Ahy_A10g047815 [Arachis hypogaea]|uniref:SWIM-type domain-containing protein n=1 Tax=Arachis hypogaea TaxID=3818 RepID=A0A445B3J0_ARAHY|nr:hypothetical protein Ahy_A10g047815 [Arachis hypogaea]